MNAFFKIVKYIGVKHWLIWVNIFVITTQVHGQTYEYVGEKFTTEHGLADDYIKDLDFDSKGNVWLLTRKGIVKFDGRTFENIQIEIDMPLLEISIDKDDFLWLNISYPNTKVKNQNRIFIYDIFENKKIKLDDYCDLNSFDNSISANLWKDEENNIYIHSTNGKVYQYNGQSIRKVLENQDKKNVGKRLKDANSIVLRKHDEIILYDLKAKDSTVIKGNRLGKYLWHRKKLKFKSHFVHKIDNGNVKLVSPKVNLVSILGDTLMKSTSYGYQYVFNGEEFYFIDGEILKVYNWESRKTINLNEILYPALAKLDIINIKSHDDKIWVNTNNGLIKIEKKKKIFQAILNHDNISAREMFAISNDSILVCTEQGVYLIDIKTNKVLNHFDPEVQTHGLTWIGGNKYLVGAQGKNCKILDLESSNTEYFLNSSSSGLKKRKHAESFLNSYYDKNNQIWVASTQGMYIYDAGKEDLFPMFKDEIGSRFITNIFPGKSEQYIFLLTQSGLFEIDVDNLSIREFKALENKILSYITIDKEDFTTYWIGTTYEGLIKWEYDANVLEIINESDGLGNNNVHSIFEDKYKRLWLSTDFGISIFNKETEEISIITEENGIHENEMNRTSFCFVNDSLIIYGGLNGLIKFNPYEVQLNDYSKELNLKSLVYRNGNNTNFKVIDLDNEAKSLTLKRSQKDVKLVFDVPENSFSNSMRYIMSADANEWNYTQGNSIDLADIKEGTTSLFISKKIGINEWSSPKTFEIYKAPPFYFTFWFLGLILSFLTILIILYLNFKRLRALKLTRRIQREVEIKTKEVFYKNRSLIETQKLNNELFGIIGHDLRSPLISLTNISASLKYLSKKGKMKEAIKLSKAVESNSKKSLAIIDRLTEWTEKQKDSLLNFSEINISKCLEKSINEQKEFAKNKNVEILLKGKHWLKCVSNEATLLIVFGNLISNAIKFSRNNSKIEIRFYQVLKEIVIEIEDYGIGMDKLQLQKLNSSLPTHSKLSPHGEKGLGVGIMLCSRIIKKINGSLLFESALNEGTKVTVKIPN